MLGQLGTRRSNTESRSRDAAAASLWDRHRCEGSGDGATIELLTAGRDECGIYVSRTSRAKR